LKKDINSQQQQKLKFLYTKEGLLKYSFSYWLNTVDEQTRSYPQEKLLAPTIGYTRHSRVSAEEIRKRYSSCQEMVERNERRGTESVNGYLVGSYGLEQEYCSVLGGTNGLRYNSEKEVIHGSDIHLTVDYNIQKKAEQALLRAVRKNTNERGGPKNGAALVMNVKTGKILGMASYPSYDPANYSEYFNPNSDKYNPQAFRNAVTNIAYDVGSVMKPLTVAAALDTYKSEVVIDGERKGVSPDWTTDGYGKKGKPYEERNGNVLRIGNAYGMSFKQYAPLTLKEIIRDSINTGIADIVDETGAEQLKKYYMDKYQFGTATEVSLPGDAEGNVRNLENDKNCPICYAQFGFGQGFTASPLQLARAYTAIANDGRMVEPYLIERIDEKQTIPSSPKQVISKEAANLTASYMKAVVEDGFLGKKELPAKLDNYVAAGKTGTAQISRRIELRDEKGNPKINEEGEVKTMFCNNKCSSERGLYDHTFVGFAPYRDPQFLVIVKLAQPNPGLTKNFSSSTVTHPFKRIMEYTLDYYNVPEDR
jgi:cell division protein FtsI/penicillin-binding protein 2